MATRRIAATTGLSRLTPNLISALTIQLSLVDEKRRVLHVLLVLEKIVKLNLIEKRLAT